MSRTVFLDRDGVLIDLVLNPTTGRFESPHAVADYHLRPGSLEALERLHALGTMLFLVSNQPDYALQKTSLDEIRAIHERFESDLVRAGVLFQQFYYCYHHPRGTVAGYSGLCICRKPRPYFLHEAARQFGISLYESWIIGDQDSDIECGERAGCQTLLIEYPESADKRGLVTPDYTVSSLAAAVDLLERIWAQGK